MSINFILWLKLTYTEFSRKGNVTTVLFLVFKFNNNKQVQTCKTVGTIIAMSHYWKSTREQTSKMEM